MTKRKLKSIGLHAYFILAIIVTTAAATVCFYLGAKSYPIFNTAALIVGAIVIVVDIVYIQSYIVIIKARKQPELIKLPNQEN